MSIKFLNKFIKRCPATIFAVNRTDKVIGRIIFLTNSMITIKFIRVNGVPDGIIWIIICLDLYVQPWNIINSHINKAVENEIDMWAVGVKINGNRAKKFINKIRKNNNTRYIIVPFFDLFFVKISISFLIFLLIMYKKVHHFEGVFLLVSGIIIVGTNKIIQIIEIEEDDGSNIEKRFIIIFNYVGFLLQYKNLIGKN